MELCGLTKFFFNSGNGNYFLIFFFQQILQTQLQIGHNKANGMDHLIEAADQEGLLQEGEEVEILHPEDVAAEISHPEDAMVVFRLEEISLQGEVVVEAIKTTQTEVTSILQCSKIHGLNLWTKTIGK